MFLSFGSWIPLFLINCMWLIIRYMYSHKNDPNEVLLLLWTGPMCVMIVINLWGFNKAIDDDYY